MAKKTQNCKQDIFSTRIMALLKNWQYLNDVDDRMMCDFLDVKERTFREYFKHPENLRLEQIDSFLNRNKMTFNDLLDSYNWILGEKDERK